MKKLILSVAILTCSASIFSAEISENEMIVPGNLKESIKAGLNEIITGSYLGASLAADELEKARKNIEDNNIEGAQAAISRAADKIEGSVGVYPLKKILAKWLRERVSKGLKFGFQIQY
jgi:hypothetical protein